jgi:putative DNA primase/helicase
MMDIRTAARALGGEVVGRGIVCPGPNHSRQDRSLSILFDASAPGGFTLYSHAGDDFGACRDYVRERLGLSAQVGPKPNEALSAQLEPKPSDSTGLALRIWRDAREPAGTPVTRYLARRGLETVQEVHDCLRFHPTCPFAGERTPGMVALVRNVVTNQPQAIHRTALSHEGEKVEVNGKDRLALGSIRGGAVKLTADEEVTTCLGIGEGIETTLSLRRLPEFGASPVWSVLNAGGITSFPVLSGIECLWIAVDDDPAGRGASELCADRWRRAGREVFLVRSTTAGADLNDILEVRHG